MLLAENKNKKNQELSCRGEVVCRRGWVEKQKIKNQGRCREVVCRGVCILTRKRSGAKILVLVSNDFHHSSMKLPKAFSCSVVTLGIHSIITSLADSIHGIL